VTSSTRPAPSTTTKPPTTPTSPFPRSLLGQDIQRIPTAQRVVALTFDAGANADAVGSILTTLAQQHVAATFFLTGDFVADFPDAARRIAAAGHRIGNHSVNHPHFPSLSDAEIRAQLSAAAVTIRGTTGANPAPLFRFPYGDRDTRTISVVNAAGYVPVRWTVDSLGWQGTMNGSRDAAFVAQRVVAAATPGEIVLMHVGSNPDDHSMLDAQALPGVIAALRAQGYGFVTLDALLASA
jgi:peptidoglycan/xylan/chitin deacetylase (PgdA/CDA1 family)